MVYKSIAVIGTAGRKDDGDRLTNDHYIKMLSSLKTILSYLNLNINDTRFISGGAAWADHLIVSLAILENGLYVGDDEVTSKTADVANYYHRKFSKVINRNTLDDLRVLQKEGSFLVNGNGNFFRRNTDVARSVDGDGLLIAYTFGNVTSTQPIWTARAFGSSIDATISGIKKGGTADTWNKSNASLKYHIRLGEI